MLLRLVALVTTLSAAQAASCGGSGIPFRFEVLPSGTPVLGCGTPQCFGADTGGRDILHDFKFSTGPDGEDGFFREGDQGRIRSRFADAPGQQAECPASFDSTSCVNPQTWVGGFMAAPDGSLRLQCCHYDGLRFGAEVGRPIVHAGEVYSGGEVLRDGRQTGFDLISNVKKIDAQDGSIAYELTVTRMNCLPDPPEDENDVGLDSVNDISRILEKVGEVKQSPATAGGYVDASQGAFSNSVQGGDSYVQAPQDAPAEQTEEAYVQVGEQVVPVTQAGYYYPVASGVPACFTGDSMVETPSGAKRMEDLVIGDLVLTAENNKFTFTEVESFMHRLPETNASFIRLETAGSHIKLTPQHFIYKVNCEDSSISDLVYAEDVNEEDCLLESTNDQDEALQVTKVLRRSVVMEKGVFAPMTVNGDLLVNDIYASCHNVIKSSTLSHTFLRLMSAVQNKVRNFFGGDSAGHLPPTAEFFLQIADYVVPHKF